MNSEPEEHSWDEEPSAEEVDSWDEEPSTEEEPEEELSPELVERARVAKVRRLFIEEKGRPPYSDSEVHFFRMSSSVERPVEPDDEDIETAKKEAAEEDK